MKAWNNIEKAMSKSVGTQETVPPAFVWEKIDQELSAAPGKNRILLYLLGLASLAILGIATLYLTSDKDTVAEQNIADKTEQQTVQDLSVTTQKIIAADIDGNTIHASESIKEVISKEVIAQVTNRGVVQKNNGSLELKKASSKKVDAGNETPILSYEKQQYGQSVDQENWSPSNAGVVSKSELPSKQFAESHSAKAVKQATVSGVNQLAGLDLSLENERSFKIFPDDINCPSFGRSRSVKIHPFLEVNGLLGRHFKNLGGASEVRDVRNNSENSWYTWGASALVGININKNFYVGTGLEWSQSKDKFFYGETALTKMVITYDPATGIPIDTSFIDGMLVNKGEIRYNMLDVPIYLGAVKRMSQWEVGLEAGLLFNLSFNVEGKMFDDQLDISRVENETDVYKSKIGLGMRTSLLFRRYLNKGWAMHFKPGFKSYLSEINHANYAIPTKIKFARLEVGLRKDF